MAPSHFCLVLVLVLLLHQSWSAPVHNGTNTTSIPEELATTTSPQVLKTTTSQATNTTSHNETRVEDKGVKKEKKEHGPSNILFPVCSGYVGVSNKLVVKDDQITASSTHDVTKLMKLLNETLENLSKNTSDNGPVANATSNFTITGNLTSAHHGRLGNTQGSWCASGDKYDGEQHLVVDFGDVLILEGVLTQGRSDSDNWVTEYTVSHSSDQNTWHPIKKNGEVVVFKGNKDRNSIAVGSFPHRVAARFVKFSPKSYHGKLICMRVEAVGCHPDAVNVAKNQPTMQSSTKYNFTSSKAVDGDFIHDSENDTCTHTRHEQSPWLRIDLRRIYYVKEIIISDHESRAGRDLRDFEVRVGNSLDNNGNNNLLCTSSLQTVRPGQIGTVVCNNGSHGRYVNIRIPRDRAALALCEVAVIGIAETVVKLGLEDIAESLKTGVVTDKAGEAKDAVGGLLGQLRGQFGSAMLGQIPGLGMLANLQGQGLGALNNLQGMGMGMLGNLQGQGMGLVNNLQGQGLDMANKLKGQGMEIANKAKEQAMKMAEKLKKQGMEMANKAKEQAMKMAEKAKKQGMEMANKAKEQAMEMAEKAKKQGMEMANKAKEQGMEMANKGMDMAKDLQNQGMGMVGDMQGQMNQQQDKFKKKLKEILEKGKEYLEEGKKEFEAFKKKGYIEAGKKYMDKGISMGMKGMEIMQAKLMESMGSIASDMTEQISTLSEYDTSGVKGLLDDVDKVAVRNFVDEARPKLSEYIDEMERLGNKYFDVAVEKAEEAKEEIESEADSAANQATSMGKNVAGKATNMGKNMADKAKKVGMDAVNKAKATGMDAMNKAKKTGMDAVNKAKAAGMDAVNKAKKTGMDAMNKAKAAGMDAVNKAKDAGMDAVNKAKDAGMDAVNKAKDAGMDAVNKAKNTGLGALDKAKGLGQGALGKGLGTVSELRKTGLGTLSQLQGLGSGVFGRLSGGGMKLLEKAKGKTSQLKQMQQIQMLQNLKHLKQMKELQDKLKEEQDGQWARFEALSTKLEDGGEALEDNVDGLESKIEDKIP